LDGVAVDSGWVNRVYLVNDATHGFGVWILEAGTDAAVAGDIVRPTNYNASTNAFVWKRKL